MTVAYHSLHSRPAAVYTADLLTPSIKETDELHRQHCIIKGWRENRKSKMMQMYQCIMKLMSTVRCAVLTHMFALTIGGSQRKHIPLLYYLLLWGKDPQHLNTAQNYKKVHNYAVGVSAITCNHSWRLEKQSKSEFYRPVSVWTLWLHFKI